MYSKRLFRHYPLIISILMAFAFSFTLLMKGNSAIVGSGYESVMPFYNTWWVSHALQHNYDFSFSNHAIFPVANNLTGVISPLSSLFFALLRPLTGAVLAYNLQVVIFSVLNSLVMSHWLQKFWKINRGWSLIGDLLLAYNPVTWHFIQQGYVPFIAIFVLILAFILFDNLIENPAL